MYGGESWVFTEIPFENMYVLHDLHPVDTLLLADPPRVVQRIAKL